MKNPLLENTPLPLFQAIEPKQIAPALDQILADNRAQLKQLLAQQHFTWKNLMQPLEEMQDRLGNMWSPVRHLHAVTSSEELRKAYNAALPKLSDYSTEFSHNLTLYNAIDSLAKGTEYEQLSQAQKKVIDNKLRDFRLSGVHLAEDRKKRLAELDKQLSQLTTQFEENVLDATQSWNLLITDETDLAGIPAHALKAAKEAADRQQKEGWLFTLDIPSYDAVITYADKPSLREQVYYAYTTRASDQGPNAGRWDNSAVMNEIMQLRFEMAQLLNFKNYAELSLATKMAKQTTEVLNFLNELTDVSLEKAKQEFAELSAFAKEKYGVEKLQPWDTAYFSEKLRQHRYAISEEELRPYFPEAQVLKGLFEIVKRLFDIHIKQIPNPDVWHKDVKFFAIYDAHNQLRGQFYLDLYSRPNKRGGAWMDECRCRFVKTNQEIQTPVCYLTCNFGGPVGDSPALLTHEEVITLFHEFGHGLQHMLTVIDYTDVSGINGVAWDAVELASQFLENWCWEKESLHLYANHFQTQEPIPDAMYQRLYQAKNFQAALDMIRQIIFAVFDFRIHVEFDPTQTGQIQKILDEVREKLSVMPIPAFNRFQNSFTHIFSGGYAAGYYSYKWAEVLASDAFSKFEETGIFNSKTGAEFLHNILETGGAEEPMDLFIKFRGRAPTVDALLRHLNMKEVNYVAR
jgi:oligopeptidase A